MRNFCVVYTSSSSSGRKTGMVRRLFTLIITAAIASLIFASIAWGGQIDVYGNPSGVDITTTTESDILNGGGSYAISQGVFQRIQSSSQYGEVEVDCFGYVLQSTAGAITFKVYIDTVPGYQSATASIPITATKRAIYFHALISGSGNTALDGMVRVIVGNSTAPAVGTASGLAATTTDGLGYFHESVTDVHSSHTMRVTVTQASNPDEVFFRPCIVKQIDYVSGLAPLDDDSAYSGAGTTVALSSDDRSRSDLSWQGTWAIAGLMLVLIMTPAWNSAWRWFK
jgi:hypothetical protein